MFTITTAQLKMFAGICANLVVVFVVSIPVSQDVKVLTFNFIGIILFWKVGVLAEEKLEDLI